MKRVRKSLVLLILCFLVGIAGASAAEQLRKSLYQVSTLQALLAGEYDGSVLVKDLLTKGDMGLGTLDKLAGEMIIYDGVAYQGRVDGKVYVVPESRTSPFANLAFSRAEKTFVTSFEGGYEKLQELLNTLVPRANMPVLFCISGDFNKLSYRSVPAQQKPYPPLVEVVKEQAVFEQDRVKGVLVGFRFPAYMSGINVFGFHLHFLSADKSLGGHLFGVESGKITVKATVLNNLEIFLPENLSKADLAGVDSKHDTEAVEKLRK